MLGPLEVRDGAGLPREVSGTRLRALLILLALRAGQVVPPSSLIDELWGERLPADAPNALQALVSRLRRAVGEPAAVVSGPAGYQLRAGRDDVDVFRFEGLAAGGHAALATRPAEAAGLLTAALALWRGEPLPDAAETQTGRAAVARLSELRLAAAEDRVEAELRLTAARPGESGVTGSGARGREGRLPALIAELDGLLSASPTRETLAGLLMRALAATGRPGEALRVFERTRARLAGELGTDPAPALASLQLELAPAAGVEASGRLVQEQHPRPADQAGGQVEAAAHAAGVGLHRAAGRVGQAELNEEFPRPLPGLRAGGAGQPADQHQVLGAGEGLVDRRVLAGQPDELADLVCRVRDAVTEHRGLARVRGDQGGEHADNGGLARPVRAEQPENLALGDGQVDAVDRCGAAEPFGEAAGGDPVDRAGAAHGCCRCRGC
jgi:DNA-binding SARP family transcriptional activator